MNTTKKLRWLIGASAGGSLAVTVLRVLSVLFELDGETGYFKLCSPFNTTANVLLCVFTVALLVSPLLFKEREIAPVINYQSSFFIFFSVMSACLMLVNAYVRWMEHSDASLRGSAAQGGAGFLLPNVICSVVSALGFFVYAFGRNEKRRTARSLIGLIGAVVLFLRAIELHFNNYIEMNHPIKIALQLALVSTALALLYMAKCEFRVCDASPRARLVTMLASAILGISYGISMLVSYYTKIYANFSFLIDAILVLALNGTVLASYMTCRKARPIAEAEWEELDELLLDVEERDVEGAVPYEAPCGAADLRDTSLESVDHSHEGEADPDAPRRPSGSTTTARVILSGASAESNCEAARGEAEVESRAVFAQDDTVGDDVLGVPAPCGAANPEKTVGTGVPDGPNPVGEGSPLPQETEDNE